MALSTTKPSTLRLSEVARHVVVPVGIVSTGWPAVEAKCREFGDTFDEWQRGAGRLMLGKRADGVYAATVGGITLSIPRQVAKTWLVGRIVVSLCLLFPGLRVLWTAHRTRTATNTFRNLSGLCQRTKLAPFVADIRRANGEQEIAFTNGSVIMFGAREQGFGRGFDEVDVEVFDEAQILSVRALEDMVAATNQSRHAHGALLFYMGTPPRPVDPSEAFEQRRADALAGTSEDAVYIECSADRDADPDDQKQWAKANPSFPHRTPLRSMLRLRKNLPSDDAWRREALGIWDEDGPSARSVIDPRAWARLVTEDPPGDGVLSYGVKFSADGESVALSVALRPEFGPIHVEGVEHRSMVGGTRWLVSWLAARASSKPVIVIDGKSSAGALYSALRKAKVQIRCLRRPTADEVITAQSTFVEAVAAGSVSHLDDAVLTGSVRSAGRRPIGKTGGWGFVSLDGGDVTLFESVVLAHHGAVISQRAVGEKPKVVVLI